MNTNFTIALYFALVIVATLFLFAWSACAKKKIDRVHLQPPFPIPDEVKRFRSIDHGVAHPPVVVIGHFDESGAFILEKEREGG